MLNLHQILWVLPGFIFIFLYNKKKPEHAINLSGWSYVFSLVFIASITWFPAELLFKEFGFTFKDIGLIFNKNGVISRIFNTESKLILKAHILGVSVIFSFIWLFFTQFKCISKRVFPPIYDNFYNQCVEWENKEILINLKNRKIYHGLLWKYPENPKSRHESQTISIVPFKSGYRDSSTQEVKWNTYYPEYADKFALIDMEVIIPRSEIITFGKFNKKVFQYFELDHSNKSS